MRFLIAEDDSVPRRILEAKLVNCGYEVIVTFKGEEALSVVQADDAPNLAILDWMMPGLDGVEICRKARKEVRELYTCIIRRTSLHREEDLVTGMEAGEDDYILQSVRYTLSLR